MTDEPVSAVLSASVAASAAAEAASRRNRWRDTASDLGDELRDDFAGSRRGQSSGSPGRTSSRYRYDGSDTLYNHDHQGDRRQDRDADQEADEDEEADYKEGDDVVVEEDDEEEVVEVRPVSRPISSLPPRAPPRQLPATGRGRAARGDVDREDGRPAGMLRSGRALPPVGEEDEFDRQAGIAGPRRWGERADGHDDDDMMDGYSDGYGVPSPPVVPSRVRQEARGGTMRSLDGGEDVGEDTKARRGAPIRLEAPVERSARPRSNANSRSSIFHG